VKSLHLHVRVYRLAVRLYPRAFRTEYGDDLVEAFTALVSDLGPRRAWTRTFIDLITTLPRYRLEALVNPQRKTAPLAAAAIAALLSLAWLATAVADLSGDRETPCRHWWSTLPAVALLVSVAALVIMGLRQRSSSPSDNERLRPPPASCFYTIWCMRVYALPEWAGPTSISTTNWWRVLRRYRVTTKREAVDLALRRAAGEPLTRKELLALRGAGWNGELEALRSDRP
jgi:hypothetical protein